VSGGWDALMQPFWNKYEDFSYLRSQAWEEEEEEEEEGFEIPKAGH
jgi:hypothetical protein